MTNPNSPSLAEVEPIVREVEVSFNEGQIEFHMKDGQIPSGNLDAACVGVRDAVNIGAALVDNDGFTFKVEHPISQEVLAKLSYVLTRRACEVVNVTAK